MSIIKEIREITSRKKAERIKLSEKNYPKLIDKIKQRAEAGETHCEFSEYEVDEYARKLLIADGFGVYATTKKHKFNDYLGHSPVSIWMVNW
jgi:predicted peroxiredoxin